MQVGATGSSYVLHGFAIYSTLARSLVIGSSAYRLLHNIFPDVS